jgi:hypothetical protein
MMARGEEGAANGRWKGARGDAHHEGGVAAVIQRKYDVERRASGTDEGQIVEGGAVSLLRELRL